MKIFFWLKKHILLIGLIASFTFLFFYHLDYNTLASWDEGWYASIARDIIRSGDFLHMTWNGQPYYDHPPMGFWLMAISFKLFGINEFSARFPSAILGLFTIMLTYKTAVELFGKKIIGFIAALVLGTSVWYLIRVRSGNLESVFSFFYTLTIYTSLRSSKQFRWFPLVMMSFAGLILSKTIIGFSAIVPIVFMNLKQLLNRKNWNLALKGTGLFLILVLPWYLTQFFNYGDFFYHHFLRVGMRDKTFASYFHLIPEQPLFYLHMGVRKWYYIWLLAVGYLIVSLKFLKKHIFFLLLWNLIVLYPFLTSEKTELWHLIPVYLPMSLVIASGAYYGIEMVWYWAVKMLPVIKKLNIHFILYLFFFLSIALIQVKIFYNEVFPQSKYTPDDVDISKRTSKYKERFFLDDDYIPLASFYSGRRVYALVNQPDEQKTLLKLFQSSENDFIVVTRNWALNNLKEANIKYKVLEQNNSFSIITK